MTQDNILRLLAPVSGKTVPLESVPDPVFAQKTVGDGIAIAPSSAVLCAPCAGKISTIHSAHHALTLSTNDGIDILMHIGLDTVMLKGEGFEVFVVKGQSVEAGQPLIAFKREILESRGKSLLTEIVVASLEKTDGLKPYVNRDVTVGKDTILEVKLKTPAAKSQTSGGAHTAVSWHVCVKNPAGIHARPAAVLTAAAKEFSSDIMLLCGNRKANAKSVVAVMGLDVAKGDSVCLKATGRDAADAMKTLIPLLESGLGEDLTKAPVSAVPEVEKQTGRADAFYGVPASKGTALGVVVQLKDVSIDVEEFGGQIADEKEKLNAALNEAMFQLTDLYDKTAAKTGVDSAAIFKAHQELLDDAEILSSAFDLVEKGRSAAFAWQQTVAKTAAKFAEMKNPMLAARANDVRDVGKRVLRLITGEVQEKLSLPDNAVLIAEDLTPSDTASLDRSKTAGFATVGGGAVSHAAILARSMGIPAVSGLSREVLSLLNGTAVLLDGTQGVLYPNPSPELQKKAAESVENDKRKRAALLADKDLPAVTTDGVSVEVAGNIGSIEGAAEVAVNGGAGVGLLRSEFLFLGRKTPPSEDEQTAVYRAIKDNLGKERGLIIRTLDVGGDKPLDYLPLPQEANPFLGVRGIRASLNAEALFRSQIRAILRAADGEKIRVMFPMIAALDELRRAKQIVEEERSALNARPLSIGMMIEVPAAVLNAENFAKEVDFFSIGTNDLTQYIMAADRGNAALAALSDGLNPAVLRAVKMTVEGARSCGKWTGVCGGLAAQESAVPLLVGLGVSELSVPPAAIPAVKAQIRTLDFKKCRMLAEKAVLMQSAAAVREVVKSFK